MIIPLGPGSLRDSSSLPEGQSATLFSSAAHTGRASPPLLFGLAPRGVFRAPDVATRAVGSYPTFSPLPNAPDRKRPAFGFASGLPQRCKHHRRFIFCGTFRGRNVAFRLRETRRRAPWRYQARCPAVADSCEFTTTGVRTFLPPTLHPPCGRLRASRRSSDSLANYIIRRAHEWDNRPVYCAGSASSSICRT
jgi:hypothetical protein